MELKDRLKQLRNEKGLTMDMFVWDINTKFNIELNKGLVSKWENGINDPSLRYASILAQYYDVSLDYLIGLTEVKTPARLLAYASKKQSDEPTTHKFTHTPRTRPTHKIRSVTTSATDPDDDDFEFEFLNLDDTQ